MNGTATRKATTPQFDLIRTLLIELGEIGTVGERLANVARQAMNQNRADGEWNFDIASEWIDNLKDLKRQARAEQAAPKAKVEIPDVPAGRYALRTEDGVKFYLVEIDNGFVKCFVQASDDYHELRFATFVPVLAAILAAGPKESSILYGKELGVCGRCGATLTSKWRLQGIGPECSKKF